MERFFEIAEISFLPKSKQEAVEIVNKQAYAFVNLSPMNLESFSNHRDS